MILDCWFSRDIFNLLHVLSSGVGAYMVCYAGDRLSIGKDFDFDTFSAILRLIQD